MKKMKKIAAIALSAVMAVSMAGCGGSASQSGSSENDTVKVGILYSATGSMAISEGAVKDAEVLASRLNILQRTELQSLQPLQQKQKNSLIRIRLRQYSVVGHPLQEKL